MSITLNSIATKVTAIVLAGVVALASTAAMANSTPSPKGGGGGPSHRGQGSVPHNYHHHPHCHTAGTSCWNQGKVAQKKCYWLPTIAGGTVTGLHKVCS
jgi:hypothetical protein